MGCGMLEIRRRLVMGIADLVDLYKKYWEFLVLYAYHVAFSLTTVLRLVVCILASSNITNVGVCIFICNIFYIIFFYILCCPLVLFLNEQQTTLAPLVSNPCVHGAKVVNHIACFSCRSHRQKRCRSRFMSKALLNPHQSGTIQSENATHPLPARQISKRCLLPLKDRRRASQAGAEI